MEGQHHAEGEDLLPGTRELVVIDEWPSGTQEWLGAAKGGLPPHCTTLARAGHRWCIQQ